MKKLYLSVFYILTIIGLHGQESSQMIEIDKYFNYLKNCDFQSVLNQYYWNDDNFSINYNEYYNHSIGFLTSAISSLIPNCDLLNKYTLINRSVSGIKQFIFGILINERHHDMLFTQKWSLDPNMIKTFGIEFQESVNIERLRDLDLLDIIQVGRDRQFNDSYGEGIKKLYGFEESTEYCILLKFENEYYKCGMNLVRYGNKWYVYNNFTPLVPIQRGVIEKISDDEYNRIRKNSNRHITKLSNFML
jgi:hypothetical protein